MRALYFDEKLSMVEVPKPSPEDGEALIKVLAAGICNTDIEIVKGYMGFKGIPGHEFVGIVEKSADPRWVGKRVVGEINIACNECDLCKIGLKKHCRNIKVLGIKDWNGAFAEYLVLPVENLHEVPSKVSNRQAVFVEPLAAAIQILEQVHIKPTDRVCVIGDGKLGLLISLSLNAHGVKHILVGKHPEKMKIVSDRGVSTLFPGAGLETALNIIRPQGTVVLKSTYASKASVDLSKVVVNEINIIGSRCGPFEPALQLLEKDLIDVNPLVSQVLPFEKALEAFELAKTKGTLKVILEVEK
jgi:threonine dehydrogenase-like Zn-dependent dehydrogenase